MTPNSANQQTVAHARPLRALIGAGLLALSGVASAAINCEERTPPSGPGPNGNIECRIDVEPPLDPQAGAIAVADPIMLVRPFRSVDVDICSEWSVGEGDPNRTLVFAELVFRQEGITDVGVLVLSVTGVAGDSAGVSGSNRVVFDWVYPAPSNWSFPPDPGVLARRAPVGVAETGQCNLDMASPFNVAGLEIRVVGHQVKVYQGGVERASASMASRALPPQPVQYRVNRHAFHVDLRLPDSIVRTNWRLIAP